MTPEEKAQTEKALQSGSENREKIPFREDTFHLTDSERKDETVNEAVKAVAELIGKDVKKETMPPETGETTEIKEISEESILKVIDDRLEKLEKVDFVTLTFSKTGMLVTIGVLMVLIWLLPVINWGLIKVSSGSFSLANLRSDVLFQLAQAPICQSSEAPIKIRIRTNNNSLSEAKDLEASLRAAGFDAVEVIYDTSVNNEGVVIATKDNEPLRQKLISALENDYLIASEAANLTEDSDFAATLLVGGTAKKSATK